jgi:outer membrane protein assembly factor BamD
MLFLFGCGEYQQILKSKDPDLKFQKALMFFEAKQYVKSQTLLDEVKSFYRGTERSEEILIYLSRSYMGQKDYTTAAEYYQAYIRNYPKGKHIVEARFQAGHCYYLNSPDARLDQTETKKAIELFTKHDVYNDVELKSRYDILLDGYCKTLRVEALTALRMTKNEIYPACINYLNTVATTCNNVKFHNEFLIEEVKELSGLIAIMHERINKLETEVEKYLSNKDLFAQEVRFVEGIVKEMEECEC